MESFKTTAESYAKREAVAGAQQKRALTVLTGGKLASGGGDLLNTSENDSNRSQNRLSTATEKIPKCFRGAEPDRTIGLLNAISG